MYENIPGRCEYMTKEIDKIIFDFSNNIDKSYTKAMLSIDAIIKYKNLCLHRSITLDEQEKFTDMNNDTALTSIKRKIDKAFTESNNILASTNNPPNNELADVLIQIIVDAKQNVIIFSHRELILYQAPVPQQNSTSQEQYPADSDNPSYDKETE